MNGTEEPTEGSGEKALSGAKVRSLAAVGIAAVGLRQVAIRAVAFGGTVVLARLLLPRDFGAVAIGSTLVMVFGFVGDAGIGAGLIRGSVAPQRRDLQAFLGLQLLVTLVLAGGTAAIGLVSGLVGQVTALMVASLPVAAFRTPGVITFERVLRYQPLAVIELMETVVYYVWAILTVLLGWGVWGLASAALVKALAGAVMMSILSPAGFMFPIFSIGRVRGLLGFGIKYQAVNGVALVRDQGVNLGTAAIAGVYVLGLWNLAYRILQVPFLLFESVWRVSFPAMARLLATGEDAAPIMERGLAVAAVLSGAMLSALVGSAPALVPSVFGHQWMPVVGVIPWASLGLMFGGPVSIATGGFLYAKGDSGAVLTSALVQTLAWFVVTFSLLHVIGVTAVGMGWMAGSIAEAWVLAWKTRRHARFPLLRPLLLPTAVGALASVAGWFVSTSLGPTLLSAVAGAGVASGIYLGGMMLVRRSVLADVISVGRRSFSLLGAE